ncbi:class I SAM-dependent methyltransferase [Nostoc sp. FACHB-152]|uniref:class I SAM-dependent methyltransferase n=1 Tax=unclassified Nostoc TaxID=2593658 RepID=UPI0016869C0C|nr:MULTISPECIES: class I SAM-dependent methyltransferase [unclassified Nostoc]MBD2446658.1 class I SAM-dependent methyltransferase [Nostoc sp. FACHB-152]MBD2466506.1 class I SAM-dependent methyltransferase [Nostoc sp. FACHB-145]
MAKSNYYDKIAYIYDQTRWLTETVAEEVADFILELVNAKPNTSFLEPGIGTGLNVLPLIKRGYSVTGIDASQAMLDQLRQKLPEIPQNLNLIHADASQLPFTDESFDVVLTVHMIHTVSNWKVFLDEVVRVLKPQGFYLNSQWITPPARMKFEGYLRAILAKYEVKQAPKPVNKVLEEINIEEYLNSKGYRSNYVIVKEWTVSNTVNELLNFYKSRAYGLCWLVSEEVFHQVMDEFEEFCVAHYGSLETELSSSAKFEIWAYTAS